eukprot:scaffold662544_cov92-Prasinocladus_malaysianus.AAC.2
MVLMPIGPQDNFMAKNKRATGRAEINVGPVVSDTVVCKRQSSQVEHDQGDQQGWGIAHLWMA